MKPLKGKISDKIRSGELPADVNVTKLRDMGEVAPPSPQAVRDARGQGVGKPSWRTAQKKP